MGHQVTLAARARGAIIRPLGDVVVLMPPLAIDEDELRRLVEITAAAIAEATALAGAADVAAGRPLVAARDERHVRRAQERRDLQRPSGTRRSPRDARNRADATAQRAGARPRRHRRGTRIRVGGLFVRVESELPGAPAGRGTSCARRRAIARASPISARVRHRRRRAPCASRSNWRPGSGVRAAAERLRLPRTAAPTTRRSRPVTRPRVWRSASRASWARSATRPAAAPAPAGAGAAAPTRR